MVSFKPGRGCRKITGVPSLIRTRIATTAMTGERINSMDPATATSKVRFKKRYNMLNCRGALNVLCAASSIRKVIVQAAKCYLAR